MALALLLAAWAAAPQLAAAEPADAPPPTALPSGVKDEGRSGGAALELLVDPQGRVVECRELAHFGDTRLAARACEVEWKGRWAPARMADGAAAYGLVRTARLFGPDRPAVVPDPDLELDVTALPGGAVARAVDVVVAVDRAGAVTSCAAAPDSHPQLAEVACSAPRRLAVRQVEVPGGEPTAYVTRRTVRFQIDRD